MADEITADPTVAYYGGYCSDCKRDVTYVLPRPSSRARTSPDIWVRCKDCDRPAWCAKQTKQEVVGDV